MTVAGGVPPGRGGCGEMPLAATLQPGDSLESRLIALPRYRMRDQPLPPGPIRLVVTYLDTTDRDRQGRLRRLTVTDRIDLAGKPVAYPSPGQLVDAALRTPGVLEAIDALTDEPRMWDDAHWVFWSRPPYPGRVRMVPDGQAPDGILEIGLFPSAGPIGFLEVLIDPWTGTTFGMSAE